MGQANTANDANCLHYASHTSSLYWPSPSTSFSPNTLTATATLTSTLKLTDDNKVDADVAGDCDAAEKSSQRGRKMKEMNIFT